MITQVLLGAFVLVSIVPVAPAQLYAKSSSRRQLGRLANGAAVTFVPGGSGDWGIEISNRSGALLSQEMPAQIEVYRGDENVRDFAAGYQSVQEETGGLTGKAKVTCDGDAAFVVEDRWKIEGDSLLLQRLVRVTSGDDRAGFFSAIQLSSTPSVKWPNAKYFAPGLLYGDPTHDGDTSPGGELNYHAKRFEFREDQLSAPLFAIVFPDNTWAAVMDMTPRGDTTWAEATAGVANTVIDERIQFGALRAREDPAGGVEFGFWFPGTTKEFTRGLPAPPSPVVRHRYHPVKPGFTQSYKVAVRFGESDSFLGMERDAWRWAWQALKPPVMHLDLEIVRRTLTDHLDDHVLHVNEIPVHTAIGIGTATPFRLLPAGRPTRQSPPTS